MDRILSSSPSGVGRRREDLTEYWFERIAVESKTAEEIREHTIPEDLSPVEKTLAMLDSHSEVQRIAGIRSIAAVIHSDRDETFHRILPKFRTLIEQSVDSEEHTAAGETLVTIVQEKDLSHAEFMSMFAQIICTCVFPTPTGRFSTDFGSIWCEALCQIIDALPNNNSFTALLDLVFNRSLHGSYVRDRLASILAKLASRLEPQIVENRLLPVFKNFINDTNADIRSFACQKLPLLAQSLGSDETVSLVLPLLVILSKDESLNVRQSCFESLLDLTDLLTAIIISNETSSLFQHINEMLISLVNFALSSRSQRFACTIATRLSDLCHALKVLHIDARQFMHETFLRLSQDKNSIECRMSCVKHFTSILQFLGDESMSNEIETRFTQLCQDNHVQLAKFFDHSQQISIWHGFLLLLDDSTHQVMFAMAKNLTNIFLGFARDPIDGMCKGSISSIPAIPESETFLTCLLDYERRIFDGTYAWRSSVLCLQAFVHLPYLLSTEQIQMKILPLIFSRIFSKQVCLRDVAVDIYVQLLRKVPRLLTRKNAFQKLKHDLLLNKSYQWRIMYIKVCRCLLVHYSKRFFKENILETILTIQDDPVLSVRIELVPLLIEIKSILRLPADRQAIAKIQNTMEHLLVDRTTTLHDLANEGLLQLDKIRSYNSNFSPDSNMHDQIKEDDEHLLDDIDSSRRSSYKTTSNNDHYSSATLLSKRLTDTSLTGKSLSSIKSPTSKRSLADKPPAHNSSSNNRTTSLPQAARSSSLVGEYDTNKMLAHKQQRRQTVTGNMTSSSRSSSSNTHYKKHSK